MVFTQFSALGAKPGRNPILVMACFFGEIDFKNTIGRAFYGGLPKKGDENSKIDPFMAKS